MLLFTRSPTTRAKAKVPPFEKLCNWCFWGFHNNQRVMQANAQPTISSGMRKNRLGNGRPCMHNHGSPMITKDFLPWTGKKKLLGLLWQGLQLPNPNKLPLNNQWWDWKTILCFHLVVGQTEPIFRGDFVLVLGCVGGYIKFLEWLPRFLRSSWFIGWFLLTCWALTCHDFIGWR